MKKMMKLMGLGLICAMLFTATACGGGGEAVNGTTQPNEQTQDTTSSPDADPTDPVGDDTGEVTGEVVDTGEFSMLVPDGWKSFPVKDVFSDDGAINPFTLKVFKGAETEWDMMSTPGVDVTYYDEDKTMMTPSSSIYDNPKDLDPFTTGDWTWEGFSAESFGRALTVIWTEDGDHQFAVTLWTVTDNGTITLEDADVIAILASIQPS